MTIQCTGAAKPNVRKWAITRRGPVNADVMSLDSHEILHESTAIHYGWAHLLGVGWTVPSLCCYQRPDAQLVARPRRWCAIRPILVPPLVDGIPATEFGQIGFDCMCNRYLCS